MTIEEMRSVGVKAGIFKREKDGSCIVSNDFHKFYDKYVYPKRSIVLRFNSYMDNKRLEYENGVKNGKTTINITKLTVEFVIDEWIDKNNISLSNDEFNLVVTVLMSLI